MTYVPARIGRKIPDAAFSRLALPTILRTHASVDISEVNHAISARLADADVSAQIETPLGSPVLMIERDYIAGDRVVAVSLGYYRSDLFRYELRLKHRTAPRPGASPGVPAGGVTG